jgi:hypothetical protein
MSTKQTDNCLGKALTPGEYVQIDEVPWQVFPTEFSDGGIRWKLLHVDRDL